jgi:hypothetical protein
MQPTDERRRTYVPPPPDAPAANPGDVFCHVCGTPNEPERRFCKSCGTPMTAAARPYGIQQQPKIGWWRRHFGKAPAGNAVYQAGDRPTLKASRRWPAWLAAIVVLAALAGTGVVAEQRGWFSSLKNRVTDKVGKPAPFVPSAMTASSQASGHGPALAIDGISNKFWAPAGGKTAGQWIQATFPQPFRLLDLDITGGIDTDQAKFLTQERPDAIVITTTDSSGHQSTFARTLKDQAGAQQVVVTAGDVVSVRLTIQSVYGSAPHRMVGVAEVEFFGKS